VDKGQPEEIPPRRPGRIVRRWSGEGCPWVHTVGRSSLREVAMTRASAIGAITVKIAAAVLVFPSAGPRVQAQGYGFGDAPGRAAYRPSSLWNDGPYYTAPHWNPYGPRPAVTTSLYYYDAMMPPYGNQPRAMVTNYYPWQGSLYPYQQGFSPFSGYAAWFQR